MQRSFLMNYNKFVMETNVMTITDMKVKIAFFTCLFLHSVTSVQTQRNAIKNKMMDRITCLPSYEQNGMFPAILVIRKLGNYLLYSSTHTYACRALF